MRVQEGELTWLHVGLVAFSFLSIAAYWAAHCALQSRLARDARGRPQDV